MADRDVLEKYREKFDVSSQVLLGRLPRPDIVHFRSACRGIEIFLRELTLLNTYAEFKSEKFPLRRRRHCVFLQTAILSSLIS